MKAQVPDPISRVTWQAIVSTGTLHPVVSQVVPASQVEQVHQALGDGTLVGRGALDWTL